MIQCEKWQDRQDAKTCFDDDDIKIFKHAITHMRSSINRLEQDFTKQNSFQDGLSLSEVVKLHNYLGMLFTCTCDLLERVSAAEFELSNYLNKYL